jgi:Protein kinase domain
VTDAELTQRLIELLRAQGSVTDAQLGAASAHFAAGHAPARCLELVGVPAEVVARALASLAPQPISAITQQLGSIASPPAQAMPGAQGVHGERFGRWRLGAVLGEGGMATVSVAEDETGRRAAIKLVHAHLLNIPEARARFAREIEATRKVRHANVVEVLDVAPADAARAWLVVELIDGGNVRDLLARHQRLPLAAALEVFAQMLEGLAAAHALKVVHRDLKPDNLLLTRAGAVKVADFGIARELDATAMTQTGSTLGTPAYMSPEQARAEPVDPRSDLYTAGVILYELLSGRNPFDADSLGATVGNILRGNAPPLFEIDPTIPEAIDELVSALLRSKPEQRPATASAVRLAIEPFVEASRKSHPRLLAKLIAEPAFALELRRDQASGLVVAARELLQMGAAQREAAGLCLLRARLLDDANADAERLLQGLAAQGVAFDAGMSTKNSKILELEQQLALTPEDPVLLQRIGVLWRQDGNVYKAAVYFRRYLRVRPDDAYVQGQLSRITMMANSTVERIAGHVRTSLGVAAASSPERAPMTTAVRAAPVEPEARVPAVETLRATWSVHGGKLVAGAVIVGALAFLVPALKRAASAREALDDGRTGQRVRAAAPDEDLATRDFEALRAAFAEGRWDAAALAAGAVLEHTEKPSRASTALLLRGRARLALGKPLGAVEDLSRVVDAYRDTDAFAEALVRRGTAYAAAGEGDRGIADLSRALESPLVQPLKALAHLERGLLFAARGDVERARADLARAETLTPPGDPTHTRALEGLGKLP